MEGTDVSGHNDSNVLNDHTYFGNGSTAGWTPPNQISGTTNTTRTSDNEELLIGSYHNYQAATSGSGGSITTISEAPDTFCPLGWQLPYGGTDGDYYDRSKSWNNLFRLYNISDDTSGAVKFSSYPFSYIRSGMYYFWSSILIEQDYLGRFWSIMNQNGDQASRIQLGETVFHQTGYDSKQAGVTLRCIKYLALLHRRHGGRRARRPYSFH